MGYILTISMFALGLIMIIKGGDIFVDAATWIAEISGIPKFIIGATIVSIATTLPELVVSSIAAYRCMPDMAVGNAVGSVTANLGLIMSIAIIFMPSKIDRSSITLKSSLMLLSCLTIMFFTKNGFFGTVPSGILAIIFAVFIVENIHSASCCKTCEKFRITQKYEIPKNIFKFAAGLAGILFGANLLVEYGKVIARYIFGIPESIIAVTMVAVGTSLPELITTLTAISKKEASLSIGNIIGANLIDMTLILPVCSAISGGALSISQQGINLDLPFCLAVIAVSAVPTVISGKFTRFQGAALLMIYIFYMYCLIHGLTA